MSFFEKPRWVRRSKAGSASCSPVMPSDFRKSSPSAHLLKANLMSKAVASAGLELRQHLRREALGGERGVVDRRRLAERAVADRVDLDLGDLVLLVAERAERLRHGAVDDLEVAAAGELLELDQREVRLDAGGVAVHDQADRAGRRDDRGLGVAVAVDLAERDGAVPGVAGVGDEALVGAGGGVERHRVDVQAVVAGRLRRARRGGGCA